jgi:predicted O-methyltransferase YrrM
MDSSRMDMEGFWRPMKYTLPTYELNLHGWNSNASIFSDLICRVHPSWIFEVGSWYGGSALHMANIIKEQGLPTEILCIDTWLGSLEHWEGYEEQLQLVEGYPTIYFQFITNVWFSGHQDIIHALPMPSFQAAEYLKHTNTRADLIYLDAAHDYESVLRDLRDYYSLLSPKGILFGDDYRGWPGVTTAVDEFAAARGCKKEIVDGVFWVLSESAGK